MKIIATGNYSLDLVCFLNTLTSDKFIMQHHKSEYDYFYPLLSEEIKDNISIAVQGLGHTRFSPILTFLVSSFDHFETREINEMLNARDEIIQMSQKNKGNQSFVLTDNDINNICKLLDFLIIPLICELESHGFKQYWTDHCLPEIFKISAEVNVYCSQYDIKPKFEQYKPLNTDFVRVFVCPLSYPYGIRLNHYSLISSDCIYGMGRTINTIAHELFHSPYDLNIVGEAVTYLASKEWVQKGHKVGVSFGYEKMDDFIEENIVDALGTWVAFQLGVEKSPYSRFNTQNDGSNVLSPYFFKYLMENEKFGDISFENYFIGFANKIDTLRNTYVFQ